MALIQSSSIVRKLQRALRLTGLPDSILAPETVPVIVVEDLSAPLVEESRGCYGVATQGSIVAENGICALVLRGIPAPYDLVVTKVSFTTDTTQIIRLIRPTVTLAGFTIVPTNFADFGLPGAPTSILQRDTAVGLPAGVDIKRYFVQADTVVEIDLNIRLFGADLLNILAIGAETVNTVLIACFEWTESSPLG